MVIFVGADVRGGANVPSGRSVTTTSDRCSDQGITRHVFTELAVATASWTLPSIVSENQPARRIGPARRLLRIFQERSGTAERAKSCLFVSFV